MSFITSVTTSLIPKRLFFHTKYTTEARAIRGKAFAISPENAPPNILNIDGSDFIIVRPVKAKAIDDKSFNREPPTTRKAPIAVTDKSINFVSLGCSVIQSTMALLFLMTQSNIFSKGESTEDIVSASTPVIVLKVSSFSTSENTQLLNFSKSPQ